MSKIAEHIAMRLVELDETRRRAQSEDPPHWRIVDRAEGAHSELCILRRKLGVKIDIDAAADLYAKRREGGAAC